MKLSQKVTEPSGFLANSPLSAGKFTLQGYVTGGPTQQATGQEVKTQASRHAGTEAGSNQWCQQAPLSLGLQFGTNILHLHSPHAGNAAAKVVLW